MFSLQQHADMNFKVSISFFSRAAKSSMKPLNGLHPNCFIPGGIYSFLTKNSIFWFTVCLKYMESKESACFTWHSELYQSRFVPYFLKKLSELRWSSIDFVNESKCGKHLNCVYKFFVQSNKHSIFSRIFFSRVVVYFVVNSLSLPLGFNKVQREQKLRNCVLLKSVI